MSAMFEKFWSAYPRREGKAACLKKWEQKKLDERAATIVAHVTQRAKDDKKWQAGFVPMPLTFINQERWTDEYERVSARMPPMAAGKSPEQRAPWPQQDVHRATLNLSMLAVCMRLRGKVPIEKLREAVKERNRMAAQFREMYGDAMPLEEWTQMRARIRERFAEILA